MSGGRSMLSQSGCFGKEEKPQAICSFRGAYANRGNGMRAARFDEARERSAGRIDREPNEVGPGRSLALSYFHLKVARP